MRETIIVVLKALLISFCFCACLTGILLQIADIQYVVTAMVIVFGLIFVAFLMDQS